jgi:hypothetical protein
VQLGGDTTVYAQELLVHDRCEGQRTERLDTGLILALGILVLALGLESEVVGQMAALVVATEQIERVWVADLETPQVE